MKTEDPKNDTSNPYTFLQPGEDTDRRQIIKRKKLPDPIKLVWYAIIFFCIDYVLFQKPLPRFLSWLLLIIPFVLLSISSLIWAYRKQFPFNSFPFDPIFAGNLFRDEKSNTFHAIMMFLVFVFLIIIITDAFLFPK